jgi:Ni,Fe-hydrogenase maturation factor
MRVSVFGNPDLKEDNLVVKLVPRLRKRFPEIEFQIEDPVEGLKPPPGDELWVILDVAEGIDKVVVFDNVDKLADERRVSLHDYDVAMELKLLKKLGKIKKLKIVAVPREMERNKALKKIGNKLLWLKQSVCPD